MDPSFGQMPDAQWLPAAHTVCGQAIGPHPRNVHWPPALLISVSVQPVGAGGRVVVVVVADVVVVVVAAGHPLSGAQE